MFHFLPECQAKGLNICQITVIPEWLYIVLIVYILVLQSKICTKYKDFWHIYLNPFNRHVLYSCKTEKEETFVCVWYLKITWGGCFFSFQDLWGKYIILSLKLKASVLMRSTAHQCLLQRNMFEMRFILSQTFCTYLRMPKYRWLGKMWQVRHWISFFLLEKNWIGFHVFGIVPGRRTADIGNLNFSVSHCFNT